MDITLKISVDLSQEAKDWIMSALSDKIAQVTAHADSATTRVQADVASLKSQITALEEQVASGGATAADLAALDTLQAKLDAIDPQSPTTLPPTPSPAPAPAGT